VQILVNNAGLPPGYFAASSSRLGPFVQTEPEDWEPLIQLNLYGVLRVTRALLPSMIDSGWGRVITIVSDAGRTGDPNVAVYAAAKAGAAGFMRSLATEVGKFHVTANSISPGHALAPPRRRCAHARVSPTPLPPLSGRPAGISAGRRKPSAVPRVQRS